MPSVAPRAFRPHYGFSERVAELLDRIDCRPAASSAEREAIFRLRYRAYLSEGTIKPSFAQSFTDPYDETDNVWLLGLYLDGELASSIRLHVASTDHPEFPSRKVFAEVLEPELAAGKIIIDPTRFVTDKHLSRANPGLPYATVRLAWLAADYFGAAHLLAAVRVEHQAFYRRTFNHCLIGEPRSYPLLTQPISLMTVHYPSVAGRVHRRYPFFRSTFFERRMLFDRDAAVAHMAFPSATVVNGMHHAA
jgi:N-acyl-L-homoserine lactone synthetase